MKIFAQTSRTTWAKCALGVAIMVPILIGIETLRYFQYAPDYRYNPSTFQTMVKIVLLLCGVLFGSALGMFIRKRVVFVLSLVVFLFAGLVSCIVLYGLESNIRADKWHQAELARIGERHELEVQIEEAQAAAEAAKAEAAAAKAEVAALKAAAAKTAKSGSSGSAARPAAKASASKSSVSAADYKQAKQYFDKGKALGKEKKYAEAIPYFEKAESLAGDAACEFCIGWCYEKLEDYARALPWFRKAAEKGDADAQYYLGQFYYFGNGVAKDSTMAVKWFRKAAEQGDSDAQTYLAMCYYCGDGVEADEETAKMWYRKAAAQGSELAKSLAPWFE